MLTEYHNLVLSGVIRTIVGCLVLFGLLPRLVLPVTFPEQPWRTRAANFLISASFVVVAAHVLVLAGMFDGVAFFALFLALWSAWAWYSSSLDSGPGHQRIFAGVLRLADAMSWKYLKQTGRDRWNAWQARLNGFEAFSILIIAAVIAGAGFIRLLPVWNHAAPFSVEYYETLEHVKRLQLSQMYILGYRVPLGLPIIAQTLSFLSQVNVAIVLHFLGGVSSMMLAGSIAYVIYRATHSLQGSIIGAALFGVFNHFLPMDMHHQVEADSVVLAAALLLPSLSFFAEYFSEPKMRTLVIALAGLFCTLIVNLFVGTLGIVSVPVVLVGALLFAFRLPWLRGGRLMITVGVTAALLAGFALAVKVMSENEPLKDAVQLLLYDQHVNRYFSLYGELPPLFTRTSAVFFGFSVVLSWWRFADRSIHLHLFSWGAFGVALLLLVQYSSDGIVAIIPSSQIGFLLSILAAINLGIAIGWCTRAGEEVLARLKARWWIGNAWQLVVVGMGLVLLWFFSPAQSLTFEHTAEPDGFAKSLYLIEQRYTPFQWTVVSHRGTALGGMNRGRFLDYGYFTSRYNPETYKHGAKDAVPTPVIFIFVERARELTNVATELATGTARAAEVIKDWVEAYQKNHANLRVFYSDEDVVVYMLQDPAVNALRE